MKVEVFDNTDRVALKAASFIAELARRAIADRGIFTLAVSGGTTPWKMLRAFANMDVPWEQIHFFQVDERLAPEGHPDRNLTHLLESLSGHVSIIPLHIHAMRVEDDPEAACEDYSRTIHEIAGPAAVIDLIHLGIGSDGHTASLVPGDPVLDVIHKDVALTGIYQGRRRMTLTYPIINRARNILWLVTGSEKSEMLQRMRKGDSAIPAGRVAQDHALVLTDRAAATTSKLY